jgi:hypothetical protein
VAGLAAGRWLTTSLAHPPLPEHCERMRISHLMRCAGCLVGSPDDGSPICVAVIGRLDPFRRDESGATPGSAAVYRSTPSMLVGEWQDG